MKPITDVLEQFCHQEDGLQRYLEAVRLTVKQDQNVLIHWSRLTLMAYLVDQGKLPILHPNFMIDLAADVPGLNPPASFINKFAALCTTLIRLAEQEHDIEKSLAAIYVLSSLNKEQLQLVGINCAQWQVFLQQFQVKLDYEIRNMQNSPVPPTGKRWGLLTMVFGGLCLTLVKFIDNETAKYLDVNALKSLGFEYTRLSIAAGNMAAQYNLGHCYMHGTGVEKDLDQASRFWHQAAERGCRNSQYVLSQLYGNMNNEAIRKVLLQRAKVNTTARKCLQRAFTFCLTAAEQNVVQAQFELGAYLYQGVGTVKNLRQAAFWFKCAAEQNHVAAQFALAHCLETGSGVEIDTRQAFIWLTRAAEQGHSAAQYALARRYSDQERRSTPNTQLALENEELALVYSALAAAQNEPNGQVLFADLFQNDRRVTARVERWANAAATLPGITLFNSQVPSGNVPAAAEVRTQPPTR